MTIELVCECGSRLTVDVPVGKLFIALNETANATGWEIKPGSDKFETASVCPACRRNQNRDD